MKTDRYVTQSAVVLGLFALLTVPQVVGHADEATAPVPTTSTETVTDSGATIVSGQGTSGTAVQGGTETVSATLTPVATNASVEASSSSSTAQASQEASAILTNANQVTPAVPVQPEIVLNLLMRDRLLICRFCQQQIFTPTWLTMTIIKISRLKPLVCPKLLSLSKKPVKPIPIRSWWTVGIRFKELLLELIRP